MPESVIEKVEWYADAAVRAGEFAFVDRKGVLFEWNDEVDKNAEHIIENESDPYPALVSELPGISLQRDRAIFEAIEDKDNVPQGTAEEAAINNADLEPVVIVGVARPWEVSIKANGIDDNNNGFVDEVAEQETSPPYPFPLRGLEIRIRCYEPASRQVRQVTVRHTFVPH